MEDSNCHLAQVFRYTLAFSLCGDPEKKGWEPSCTLHRRRGQVIDACVTLRLWCPASRSQHRYVICPSFWRCTHGYCFSILRLLSDRNLRKWENVLFSTLNFSKASPILSVILFHHIEYGGRWVSCGNFRTIANWLIILLCISME